MPKITENELRAKIKSAQPDCRVFLFYGDEKAQLRYYINKLRAKFAGKEPDDFSLLSLSQDNSVQEIYDAVFSAPAFLADKKFVEVTDYDFGGVSDGELDGLSSSLGEIPQHTTLLIAYPATSPSFAQGGGKRLLTAVEKVGVVVNFERLTDTALEKQLVYWASLRNVKLNEYDAARIVSYCGRDLALLKNELEKLCAYKQNGEITRGDVELLVTKNPEAKIFDVASHILSGSPDKAIEQINILISQKQTPQSIISVLGGFYADIYRARAALEGGESLDSAAKKLGYGRRAFALQRAYRSGKRLSSSGLRASLNAIAKTNALMNSSSADPEILLEQLVARLTLIRTEEKN